MSSLTINLEIGHDSSVRTKTTPEGFTHDWEVFVKGCNGADISHYVEKVVFILHETFAKPKRVVKDPPFSVRTSGYAGFNLPIQIYLKNNQEPKKIQFNYDLQLQPSGPPLHKVQKEKYTFHTVSEDFRNKLLKGGAVIGTGSVSETNSSKFEEKAQMSNKSKIFSSDQSKKYKIKPDEPRSNQFTDLFGTPITKTSRSIEAPKIKEPVKSVVKSSEKEKISISDKDKNKSRNSYKDKERDKDKEKEKSKEKQTDISDKKTKDDKKDRKEKKDRENSKKDKKDRKDRDKEKEKEREKSPSSRIRSPSPKKSPKRVRSPSPIKNNVKEKEQTKEKEKEPRDRDREKEKKAKKHKEKDGKYRERDKEKDKERDRSSDHAKDHKNKESKSSKEREKDISINNSVSGLAKERDRDVSPMVNTQPPKIEKKEKVKEKDTREPEKQEKEKEKEKVEEKPKHKHKKKDKDRKEKREEKSHKKEKDEKKPDKERFSLGSSKDLSKDRDKTNNLFGHSPKCETSPSPPPPEKPVLPQIEDDSSNLSKSSGEPSPVHLPPPPQPQSTPTPPRIQEPPRKTPLEESPIKKVSTDDSLTTPTKKKEKKEKKKDRKTDKDHEKKRKRKVEAETQVEIQEPPLKVERKEEDTNNNSDDERKVSSSEDANPIPYSDDGEAYMTMLRELQHKIMGLKDNSDLQKVVQLIAETGRYEVSAHTFDFDLCLLDRSTVMQLQSFFSSVN